MNRGLGEYTDIAEEAFYSSINSKKEFTESKNNLDCLQSHQRFLANFINPLTPYNGILINHQPGLGKTLAGISISENFKKDYHTIVFIKNKILEMNFRKELLSKCSNYATPEERRIMLSNPSVVDYDAIELKNKVIKDISGKMSKKYSFYTYGGLTSETAANKPENFNNKVVIFDEIHNATGNSMYFEIIKLLKKSYNFKVILLTATPVFESVSEIFEISNFLNVGQSKDLLPIRNELFDEKLLIRTPRTTGSPLNDSVSKITEKGKDVLRKSLKGKVSYLTIDETKKTFAQKIFMGTPISKKGVSLNIVKSTMSGIQEKEYVKTLKINKSGSGSAYSGENVMFKDSSDISTIIYPDSTHGKEGFNKFIKNKTSNILKMSELNKFSPKIYNIIKNVQEIPGSCFIYSNFVNNGGTSLISEALKANGFSMYPSRTVANTPAFVVLGENMSIKKRQNIIRIFNSKANINGDIIKVVIGSPSISEGVSLQNIRSIHVLEPHWNLSRIDQIIGRGVRFMSHSRLPEKDRNVKIFLHACISSTGSNSIDLLKYELSEKKDIFAKEISQLLKEIAVDCSIYKGSNIRANTENNTRICNYQSCDYICPGTKNLISDNTTYDLKVHSPYEYNFILETIKTLFTKGFVYTFDYIVKYILKKEKSIDIDNIKFVLAEITMSRSILKNPNNFKSILVSIGDVYFVNPEDNEIDEDFFFKMFKKEIKQKDLPKEYSYKKIKHVKKMISPIKNKDKIIGVYDGKVFRIIHNITGNNVNKDARKNKTGKACSSYDKDELKKMMEFFNIKTDIYTKSNMCMLLEKHITAISLTK